MNVLSIALVTVVWSTMPQRSHIDYRQYNYKLHRGAKMEMRHIPMTRTSGHSYTEFNRKRKSSSSRFEIQATRTKRRGDWKQANRKFYK